MGEGESNSGNMADSFCQTAKKKFYETQGDVKAATGKEGREGTKREGTNTRDDYR